MRFSSSASLALVTICDDQMVELAEFFCVKYRYDFLNLKYERKVAKLLDKKAGRTNFIRPILGF